jgi:hypothetical protein
MILVCLGCDVKMCIWINCPSATYFGDASVHDAVVREAKQAIAAKDLWCEHHVYAVDGTTVTMVQLAHHHGHFGFVAEETMDDLAWTDSWQ